MRLRFGLASRPALAATQQWPENEIRRKDDQCQRQQCGHQQPHRAALSSHEHHHDKHGDRSEADRNAEQTFATLSHVSRRCLQPRHLVKWPGLFERHKAPTFPHSNRPPVDVASIAGQDARTGIPPRRGDPGPRIWETSAFLAMLVSRAGIGFMHKGE